MNRSNGYSLAIATTAMILLSGCFPGLPVPLPDSGSAHPPTPNQTTVNVTLTVNGDEVMTVPETAVAVENDSPPDTKPLQANPLELRASEVDQSMASAEDVRETDDPCAACDQVRLLGPMWFGSTATEHNQAICSGAPVDQIDVGSYKGCSDYLK